MSLDFLRSKLSRSDRGEPALGTVPAQAISLADIVTAHRYAALERLYVEAGHDVHRQARLAEHLRAELPDLQAEYEALHIVAKGARVSLSPVPALDPHRRSAFMAELLDSVGGFDYPTPVLVPAPTGEAPLRRAFSALAQEARAQWVTAAHLRREVEQLEERTGYYRQGIESVLAVLTGTLAGKSGPSSRATRAGVPVELSLQEGLTLRVRSNHIAGVIIAFLSLSILMGLLIVNSGAVTGRSLPAISAPAAPAAATRGGAR